MSRMYIVNHWNDAAAYSGEQIGDRLKDSSALHFNRDGSANVNLYSEETALARKKTSVPLIDRVLPQQRRVRVLTEQLYELEAERKNGLDLTTYSQLRDVLIVKRDRAELLLQKALSVRPIRSETDEDSLEYTPASDFSSQDDDGCGLEECEAERGSFIEELSDGNMFKSFLKKALHITRKVIHYKHKISSYLNELKAV